MKFAEKISLPAMLSVLLSVAILSLSLLTANLRSYESNLRKEAEQFYRQARLLRGSLTQLKNEVQQLKTPLAIQHRLRRMREAKPTKLIERKTKRPAFHPRP